MVTTKTEAKEIIQKKQTASERFAMAVERQFTAEIGNLNMTSYDKQIAQHLFIKIDAALATMEAERSKEDITPYTWDNVDMRKLSIDAVHRVQLGIDALIPGSLYPIAYFNRKTKKYDLDLRVGYRGELYYKQKASTKPIRNVRVELVYSSDEFTVYKAGAHCALEGYDFKVTQPFDRGELVGGFGYIEYEDDKDNVLVILSRAEIDKYAGTAPSKKFWGPWYDQMAYKTIVHRVMDKIVIDPTKVNTAAMASVDADEARAHDEAPALPDETPLELPPEDVQVDEEPAPEKPVAKKTEDDPF